MTDIPPRERLYLGDAKSALEQIEANTVQTCVTSPPYFGLRDYGVDGQVGLESTPDEYVSKMVDIFREVHQVLRDDGTLWLIIGDSYANVGKWGGSSGGKHAGKLHGNTGIGRGKRDYGDLKSKDLIGIPWRLAFALQADGWYLRQDIIWHKPNPMPESVKDRCTKSHEYIFLLSKSPQYYYDYDAVVEMATWGSLQNGRESKKRGEFNGKTEAMPGRNAFRFIAPIRNKRSVWTVPTKPYAGAHFAVFPPELITPCILAGSREDDIVLDPFMGSGTTGIVSKEHGRQFIGIDINPEYMKMAAGRIEAARQQFELEL